MTNGGGASRINKRWKGARRAPTIIWILPFVICHFAAAAGAAAAAPGGERPARVVYLFRDSLWSADPDGGRARSLTKGMAVYAYDVTADGERVAFAAGTWRGERKRRELVDSEIWVVKADSTGLRRLVVPSKAGAVRARVGQLRWSPDGQSLAFDLVGERGSGPGGGMLFVVRLGEGTARRAASEPVASFAWTPAGGITYRPVGQGPAQTAGSSPSPNVIPTAAPPLPPGAVPQPQPSLSARSPAEDPSGVRGLPAGGVAGRGPGVGGEPLPGSRGVGAGAD